MVCKKHFCHSENRAFNLVLALWIYQGYQNQMILKTSIGDKKQTLSPVWKKSCDSERHRNICLKNHEKLKLY